MCVASERNPFLGTHVGSTKVGFLHIVNQKSGPGAAQMVHPELRTLHFFPFAQEVNGGTQAERLPQLSKKLLSQGKGASEELLIDPLQHHAT